MDIKIVLSKEGRQKYLKDSFIIENIEEGNIELDEFNNLIIREPDKDKTTFLKRNDFKRVDLLVNSKIVKSKMYRRDDNMSIEPQSIQFKPKIVVKMQSIKSGEYKKMGKQAFIDLLNFYEKNDTILVIAEWGIEDRKEAENLGE